MLLGAGGYLVVLSAFGGTSCILGKGGVLGVLWEYCKVLWVLGLLGGVEGLRGTVRYCGLFIVGYC